MLMFNVDRMRKRAYAVLPREPEPERDGCDNVVYERCGWKYVGGPDSSYVKIWMNTEAENSWLRTSYGMQRSDFDSMTDEAFAAYMRRMLLEADDS